MWRLPGQQQSGLFYSVAGGSPVTAEDLRTATVARLARGEPLSFDVDFLRGYAQLHIADDTATPFLEIRRAPPLHEVALEESGALSVRPWLSTTDLPPARLRGAVAMQRYLAAFDAAVDRLAPAEGPLAVMASGGLDSTFLIASLVRHASIDRPIFAYHHAPAPSAHCEVPPGREADEQALVQALAEAYPGKIVVRTVTNEAGTLGLDSAAAASERTWWPVLNPANQIWMDQIRQAARQEGAAVLFTGSFGNFAFSDPHLGELRDAYDEHRFVTTAQMMAAQLRGGRRARAVAGEIRRPPGLSPMAAYRDALGIPAVAKTVGAQQQKTGRERWLDLLMFRGRCYAAGQQSGAPSQPPWVDPFTTWEVISAAAAIHPVEWQRGPFPRGFARRAGAGRVPDVIRLRRVRGQQSADAWWHMRHHRDRYFDEWSMLESTPVLGGWLDSQPIWEMINRWRWSELKPPPVREMIGVDRILALAAYIRFLRDEVLSAA